MSDDDERDVSAILNEEKTERVRRKSETQKLKDTENAYREMMGTTAGRHVLWDILAGLGVYQTPFVVGAQDLTYVNIGRQNAGIELLVRLSKIAPAEYLLMQEENSQ